MNLLKGLILLSAIGITLSGCGSTSEKTDGFQASKEEKSQQDNTEEKPATKLASSLELIYDFEHNVETVTAELWFGQNDYYIYLPKSVKAVHDEGGKDIITTLEIPTSTMEIEIIEKSNLADYVKFSKDELALTYPNQQISEDQDESVFSYTILHQLEATDDETSSVVYFLEIEGKVFKIKQHIWNSEIAETIRFNTMINNIGTFSETIAK